MPNYRFPITPTKDDIWVIRWHGDCRGLPGSDSRQVKVFLSRLNPLFLGKATMENEACFDAESLITPHEAWIPIGALPALGIGTALQNEEPLEEDLPARSMVFTIDQPEKGYLFPVKGGVAGRLTGSGSDCYSLPASADESVCCVYTLPGNFKWRLIIPSIEIARYYYFRTRNLTNKIIAGTVKYPSCRYINDANDLYDMAGTGFLPGANGTSAQHLFVKMRSGAKITDDPQFNDVIVAARIHFEKAFKREVWRLIDGLRLSHINTPHLPQMLTTKLPLSQPTKLRVLCKKFRDGDYTKILVLRILGCSAEILDGLPMDYSVDNQTGIPSETPEKLPSAFEGAKPAQFVSDPSEKSEGKKRAPLVTSDDSEPGWVFPSDMICKGEGFVLGSNQRPVLRPRKDAVTASKGSGPILPMPECVSVNEGEQSGTNAAQANIRVSSGEDAEKRKPRISADFTGFKEVLGLLSSKGFSIRWIFGKEQTGLDPAPCGVASYLPVSGDTEN